MAALLSTEMGNTDKMVGYFTECRDLGLNILPPDVNQSGKDFSVSPDGIRFGLAAIKNVGESAVDSILDTRNQGEHFLSFFEFCCRMDFQKVNKRVLEGLIKVGAFDSLGAARSQLLSIMDNALEEANRVQRMNREGQTSLFDVLSDSPQSGLPDHSGFPLPNIPEWSQDQLLKYERELTGFYITAHPLTRHATAIRRFATGSTGTLSECGEGKEVKLCGVISSIKHMTTKKGDRMAYVRLEDLQGTVEVILFPDLFKNCSELIEPEALIQLTGTVDQMDNGARVKATAVQSLVDLQARDVKQVMLIVEEPMVQPSALTELEKIFQRYPGPTTVAFTFQLASQLQVRTSGLSHQKILPSTEFLEEVEQVLGKGSAILQ